MRINIKLFILYSGQPIIQGNQLFRTTNYSGQPIIQDNQLSRQYLTHAKCPFLSATIRVYGEKGQPFS